jgi:hypothetical protein
LICNSDSFAHNMLVKVSPIIKMTKFSFAHRGIFRTLAADFQSGPGPDRMANLRSSS